VQIAQARRLLYQTEVAKRAIVKGMAMLLLQQEMPCQGMYFSDTWAPEGRRQLGRRKYRKLLNNVLQEGNRTTLSDGSWPEGCKILSQHIKRDEMIAA
jgi:hypothetical protein